MKILVALIVGIAIGATALWLYTSSQGQAQLRATGQQIETAANSARDAISEKLRVLDLRPKEIREDLERTGQVVRKKAREVGNSIADATADARTTAAIKGKLLADPDLSALSISVNTTAGVVTLSGTVSTAEDIGKAMVLAMDFEGVHEVISTLQLKKADPGKR